MTIKAGKIWGETELILANNSLEFHRIDYKKGGVCSKHLHEWKWNGFYVMSGQMKIRVWQKDYDLVDETILNPGDFTAVKPGLYHSFEGMEDGVAFELYWANFSVHDIKRESVGHLKDVDGKIVRLDKNKKNSMTERLVNVVYFGGSHGAFLKYFIDKFSALTPEIKSSPFLDNGTSHNLDVQYSERVRRYTFEDIKGNPRNNYKFENKGEPHILVTLDESSLMNYSRLHFTRESDHEFTGAKVEKSNNGVMVSDNFVSMYAEKFLNMYNIDLNKKKSVPCAVLRDFIKFTFTHIKHNKSFIKSKTTMQNIDENTVCISLSEIWNTDQFMKKMKEISDKFKLQLVLDQSSVEIHKKFLSRRINHETWNRVYDIIEDVKNKRNTECHDLDYIEQGYLYAWLEKSYDFVQAPLTRKFFADTNEINEYVTYYPTHYKAMNPNLPVFNNIANPFYLWNKNKTTDLQ